MMKVLLPLLLAPIAWTAEPQSGLWDATITVNKVEISFRMEIAARGNRPRGAFLNGDARVTSTAGQFQNNALTLQFAYYASRLEATWTARECTGA